MINIKFCERELEGKDYYLLGKKLLIIMWEEKGYTMWGKSCNIIIYREVLIGLYNILESKFFFVLFLLYVYYSH